MDYIRASPVAQTVKNLPVMQETWVRSLGQEDPLEKGTATHSTNKIYQGAFSWWLSSKGPICRCRRGRFDPSIGKIPWRRKWQPTPVFLPGKPHGQRGLAGYSPRGCKESGMIEGLNDNKIY